MKLCTIFERNRAIRGGVIAISVFDLMTLNIALRVALGSGIIFTKFDLRQLIRAWILAFLCWYVMSRRDLDLWPFDLELLHYFGCHAFKLCTKFERNRIIHGWVTDDLACFRRAIFLGGGGTFTERFSGVHGPNFTELSEDIGRSLLHKKFVLEFGYLAAFSKVGGSNLSDADKNASSHFLTICAN